MLNEARRLHTQGFAIHWLKPKSKQPLESGWTKGPKKSWGELENSYRKGYNMGVRLGKASQFSDGTFLYLIDVDIKSPDPKHLEEAQRKLKELIPVCGPVVTSGRGNGSGHHYLRSSEPVAPRLYARSTEKVKVLMPSAKPSRHEKEKLNADEIESGFRFRPAWEISIMGEGQQVVLPPSIHPDTGKLYRWASLMNGYTDLPLKNVNGIKKQEEKNTVGDFKFMDVDLELTDLDEATIDLIVNGTNCEDRSAALFKVTIAMLRAGFDDGMILSVLTDNDFYLGATGFDHAKTEDRSRAAEWVRKFTLEKAKRETLASEAFRDAVEIAPLGDEEAKKQELEILSERHWTDLLDKGSAQTGGKLKPTLKNLRLILQNEVAPDIFKKDEFAGTRIYGVQPPWNRSRIGSELKDDDITNMNYWFIDKHGTEFPEEKIYQAIAQIASQNAFHPVREFLEGLEWDGVPRINTWIKDYLGGEAREPYLTAVSRKTLLGMIARIYEPGVKFDTVLILEGNQGIGKSTAARILASPWFSDTKINVMDKDSVMALKNVWVLELGELSAMKRAEVEDLKEYISRQVDRIRVPYGRLAEDFKRQSIFIGTTNREEYLKDTGGNRRFWPVKVKQCLFDELTEVRDQLLAEAKFEYDLGEQQLYLTKEEDLAAIQEQTERIILDPWVEALEKYFKDPAESFPKDAFSIGDLFKDFGPFWKERLDPTSMGRVGTALRFLGFSRQRMRKNKERVYLWTK